jgi:hypothetical protein
MTNIQILESPSAVQRMTGAERRKTAASKGDGSESSTAHKKNRLDSSNLNAPPTGHVATGKTYQAAAAAVVPTSMGSASWDTPATTSSMTDSINFNAVHGDLSPGRATLTASVAIGTVPAPALTIATESTLPMDAVMSETKKAAMSVQDSRSPSTLSSSDHLIEKQKARAIYLLEQLDLNSYSATTAKKKKLDDVVTSVRADLKLGVVPPVYHALVRGCDPFGVNTSVSFDEVKAGSVTKTGDKGPELKAEGNMWQSLFAKDGGAYEEISDEGLCPREWTFSLVKTQELTELVNTKAKMIGEDLETTGMLPSVFDLEYIKSDKYTLFTRCLSRGVAASCFCAEPDARILAITGSPGIGKSWTLLYLLQQAMMYDNACVVFINQKTKMALLCVRKGNAIFVWRALPPYPAYTCLFTRKNVLTLLDPKESRNGGADFETCDGRLIYAASNNEEHFKSDAIKNRVPFQYLSPWTVNELEIALPAMKTGIEMDVVWEKAKEVGLLPRYFVKEEQVYDERKSLNGTGWTRQRKLPQVFLCQAHYLRFMLPGASLMESRWNLTMMA